MDNRFIKGISDNTSFDEKIDRLFRVAVQSSYSVAIWRTSNSDHINGICQLSDDQYLPDEIERSEPGFILAPFKKDREKKFIKADLTISSIDNKLKCSPTFTESQNYETFNSAYQNVNLHESFDYTSTLESDGVQNRSKKEYLDLVQKTIDAVKSGNYQKIVPSRTKSIDIEPNFDPIKEFKKLCSAYPSAFVSLVYVPNDGIWLGATPELLISIDQNKTFKTVALAGTQSIPSDFQLSKAAWTQKDIEEQALVSRYIINCFKKIRLREFEEYGPKTVKAANLIHLKTEFEVDIDEVNFPQLGTVMLDLLHPTSAVCGMPMVESADFLEINEGYDREYYSGYLGPVNIENETNVFVNLRCMKILKNTAVLFAGGGITEDSEPESEWMETEMKFQTLLNVIKS